MLYEWRKHPNEIVRVELVVLSDILLDCDFLYSVPVELGKTSSSRESAKCTLLGSVSQDGITREVYATQDKIFPDSKKLRGIDVIDYYYSQLCPPHFARIRNAFTTTWYELVTAVKKFEDETTVTVTHFSTFNRAKEFKAIRSELEQHSLFPVACGSNIHGMQYQIDVKIRFAELPVLSSVAEVFKAIDSSGGMYNGWEMNVAPLLR